MGYGPPLAVDPQARARGGTAGVSFEGRQRNRFVRADALDECGEVSLQVQWSDRFALRKDNLTAQNVFLR